MAVHTTRVSMEVIVTIVSKLVYFTYLRDKINLYILWGLNLPIWGLVVFHKCHGHPNLLYQKSFS